MHVSKDFGALYEVKLLSPQDKADKEKVRLFRPAEGPKENLESVTVEVVPKGGQKWIGIFMGNYDSPPSANVMMTAPNERDVCIVIRGIGYIVDVLNPDQWQEVRCHPILDIYSIREKGVLIFKDFTRLTAYDLSGFRWRTRHISWDGITVEEVNEERISGTVYEAPTASQIKFSVEIDTGEIAGATWHP